MTAVIWGTLVVAEQTFRRLDAPELVAEVAERVTYVNGVRARPRRPNTLLDKTSDLLVSGPHRSRGGPREFDSGCEARAAQRRFGPRIG